jgi:transposase-like protein
MANAIESVNYRIQKIIKHRQFFPNEDAAVKLIFMGLKNISGKWRMPIRDWGAALDQFAIIIWGRQGSPMMYRLHKIIYTLDFQEPHPVFSASR